MKKVGVIGIIVGVSFLAGAIFFALTFGFFQETPPQPTNIVQTSHVTDQAKTLGMPVVTAEDTVIPGRMMSFAPLVKKVRGAVVKVRSEAIMDRRGSYYGDDFLDRFFDRGGKQPVTGTGSGFFISADGYILTNNHVVQNAIKITVIDIDQKEYIAKKVGTDPKTDLALIKINGDNFPFIELGDSDALEVGEWVLAIGNPLEQDLSVTSGIVSAKGRNLEGLDVDYQNFIQTDAAINRGNSGGPLINMEGKAVGINSVILSPGGGNIGIGFSIPSNMAKKVILDLKKEGRVIRGYIGVNIYDVTEKDLADLDLPMRGVLVIKVEEDTPAQKAGLKKYDLITEINGKRVTTSMELRNQIASIGPGETIELTVYRNKEKIKVKIKVAEAPDSIKLKAGEQDSGTVDLGMVLSNNSRALAQQYDLSTSEGVVIVEIERGGIADQHGLRIGDVITGVNRSRIDDIKQFREIMSQKKGSTVFLSVVRGDNEYFIRFSIPE